MSVKNQKSQFKIILKESLNELLRDGSNQDLRNFVKTCIQEMVAEGKLNEIAAPQMSYQNGQQFINIPQMPNNNMNMMNQYNMPTQAE